MLWERKDEIKVGLFSLVEKKWNKATLSDPLIKAAPSISLLHSSSRHTLQTTQSAKDTITHTGQSQEQEENMSTTIKKRNYRKKREDTPEDAGTPLSETGAATAEGATARDDEPEGLR